MGSFFTSDGSDPWLRNHAQSISISRCKPMNVYNLPSHHLAWPGRAAALASCFTKIFLLVEEAEYANSKETQSG